MLKRWGRRHARLRRIWGRLRWRTSRQGIQQLSRGLRYAGWQVQCPLCGWRGRAFWPHDDPHPRPNAMCPRCYAKERHRALFGYLARRHPHRLAGRVLEVAPGPYSYRFFGRFPKVQLVGLDYGDPNARVRGDLTRLPLEDASIDVALCFHVLEHVPDDIQAMRELRRIVRPEGVLFLQVPIVPASREVTHDGTQITDPDERTRLFGQSDHVRAYGWDIVGRLERAGFAVRKDDMTQGLASNALERAGITPGDTVLICTPA